MQWFMPVIRPWEAEAGGLRVLGQLELYSKSLAKQLKKEGERKEREKRGRKGRRRRKRTRRKKNLESENTKKLKKKRN